MFNRNRTKVDIQSTGGGGKSLKPGQHKLNALPGDFTNPALRNTCFRCWTEHSKNEKCKAAKPLPRPPTTLPVTEVDTSEQRNVDVAKDKDKDRGIIDKMYLFIMSDNNNDTNLIPSNLPIKQVSMARNNDVLFRNPVVTHALYDTGASHNCVSEALLEKLKLDVSGLPISKVDIKLGDKSVVSKSCVVVELLIKLNKLFC